METLDLVLDTFSSYAWITIPASLAMVALTIKCSWSEALVYSSLLAIIESFLIIPLYPTHYQYVGLAGVVILIPTLLIPPYLLGLLVKKILE